MSRKPRDYKAEYQRRIARADSRGYSRSIARGHAKRDIAGIRLAKVLGVKPGTFVDDRPRQPPAPPGTASFQQRLEKAGFVNFIVEARKRYLARETPLRPKRINRVSVSQESFIQTVVNAGHTEREAYAAWFSPK